MLDSYFLSFTLLLVSPLSSQDSTVLHWPKHLFGLMGKTWDELFGQPKIFSFMSLWVPTGCVSLRLCFLMPLSVLRSSGQQLCLKNACLLGLYIFLMIRLMLGYSLPMRLVTVNVDLDHLAERVSACYVSPLGVTLSFPTLSSLEGKSLCMTHARSGDLCSTF